MMPISFITILLAGTPSTYCHIRGRRGERPPQRLWHNPGDEMALVGQKSPFWNIYKYILIYIPKYEPYIKYVNNSPLPISPSAAVYFAIYSNKHLACQGVFIRYLLYRRSLDNAGYFNRRGSVTGNEGRACGGGKACATGIGDRCVHPEEHRPRGRSNRCVASADHIARPVIPDGSSRWPVGRDCKKGGVCRTMGFRALDFGKPWLSGRQRGELDRRRRGRPAWWMPVGCRSWSMATAASAISTMPVCRLPSSCSGVRPACAWKTRASFLIMQVS